MSPMPLTAGEGKVILTVPEADFVATPKVAADVPHSPMWPEQRFGKSDDGSGELTEGSCALLACHENVLRSWSSYVLASK